MATETRETLRQKANEAVSVALEDTYEIFQELHGWRREDERYIAEAVLDAVGFDAWLEERKAMREALQWYSTQIKRMASAILAQNNIEASAQIDVIGMDFGLRADTALKEQVEEH